MTTDKSFSKIGGSIGLHYYPDGLVDNSVGFGVNFASAKETKKSTVKRYIYDWFNDEQSEYEQEIDQEHSISNMTYEIMYNKLLGESIMVSPTLFLSSTIEKYETRYSSKNKAYSGKGFGLYITTAKSLKRGYGFSVYYKRTNISDDKAPYKSINTIGLEFIW